LEQLVFLMGQLLYLHNAVAEHDRQRRFVSLPGSLERRITRSHHIPLLTSTITSDSCRYLMVVCCSFTHSHHHDTHSSQNLRCASCH
jgi:hypothetical protein